MPPALLSTRKRPRGDPRILLSPSQHSERRLEGRFHASQTGLSRKLGLPFTVILVVVTVTAGRLKRVWLVVITAVLLFLVCRDTTVLGPIGLEKGSGEGDTGGG